MTQEELDVMLELAAETNKRRGEDEREVGFASPESSVVQLLRTVRVAVECGMLTDDIEPIAEGLSMLDEALQRIIYGPASQVMNEIMEFRAMAQRGKADEN